MKSPTNKTKKQMLWNIIEPGDPFDIKKSMIAKLPGYKPAFMGQNIQMVCLLQAAQIQRLSEYLEDYKLKYREVERKELDRHSYEIQIKELTEQSNQQSTFKIQNTKLRQFIRRQTAELEDVRRKLDKVDPHGQNLSTKYELAITKIQQMNQEITSYHNQKRLLLKQIEQFKAKYLAIQAAKNRQIQLLKKSQLDHNIYESQKRQIIFKYESQASRMQIENRKYKETIQNLNTQNGEMIGFIRHLQHQIQILNSNVNASEFQVKIADYQTKLALYGSEIQRLNLIIRDKSSQINQLYLKHGQLDKALRSSEVKIQQYQIHISKLNKEISSKKEQILNNGDYEQLQNKVTLLSMEVDRVNELMRAKVQEYNLLLKKTRDYEYEIKSIEIIKRQNEELKRDKLQFGDLKRKIAEQQNRLLNDKLQISRMENTLIGKDQEIRIFQTRNKSLQFQLENYRKRNQQLQSNVSIQWKNKILVYEQKILSFTEQHDKLHHRIQQLSDATHRIAEYENRIAIMNQQMERLTQIIKVKTDEHFNIEILYKKIQIQLQSYKRNENTVSFEWQTKITHYEHQINLLNKQNQQLKKKVNQFNDAHRRKGQYQRQIGSLKQDIQKLQFTIKSKSQQFQILQSKYRNSLNQVQNIEKKLKENEMKLAKQYKLKIAKYEETIKIYTLQIEQYKKKTYIQSSIIEYENKIALMSQEIERLTLNLNSKTTGSEIQKINQSWKLKIDEINRVKSQQINRQQARFNSLNQQLQIQRRKMIELESLSGKSTFFEQKIKQYQMRIKTLIQQNQVLNKIKIEEGTNNEMKLRNMHMETQNLRRRLKDIQSSISNEMQLKITSYQQRIHAFNIDNEDLRRKIRQYDNKLLMISQQADRSMKLKIDELNAKEIHIRKLTQQIELHRRKFIDTENTISVQWKNKTIMYEQTISTLHHQIQETKRINKEIYQVNKRIPQYQNQRILLNNQIEKLNQKLRIKFQQSHSYQLRTSKMEKQLQIQRRKMLEYENNISHQWAVKISSFQQKITLFTNQNIELKRKNKQITDKLVYYEQIIQKITNQNQQLRHRLGQSERNIGTKHHQIERLNKVIAVKIQQLNSYQIRHRNMSQQFEISKRRLLEFQSSVTNQWNMKMSSYEQRGFVLSQQNEQLKRRMNQLSEVNRRIPEYENRIAIMSQQCERLTQSLRIRTDEASANENKCMHLQQQLQFFKRKIYEIQSQWTMKVNSYEENISFRIKQNQQLRRIVSQFESRVGSDTQRLNGIIRGQAQQIHKGQIRVRNIQQENQGYRRKIQQFNNQFNSKTDTYQKTITKFRIQNQQLRKRFDMFSNERKGSLDNINAMVHQIERLNINFKLKIDELHAYELRNSNLQKQLQIQRKKNSEYQFNLSNELNMRFSTYQQKITLLIQQNQQLKRRNNDHQGNKRISINQYQTKIAFFSQEIQRLNMVLRENNNNRSNFNSEFEDIRNRQNSLNQEIERLNILLRQRNEQISKIKSNENTFRNEQWKFKQMEHQKLLTSYTMISTEYQNSKKSLQQYEISIKKLYGEFQKLQSIMQEIKKENYNLKMQIQKGQSSDDRNRILSIEIDRLTKITEQQKAELQEVRMRMSDGVSLQKRIQEHMGLMVILFAEIETLRKRIKDKEKEVEQVRRSSLAPFKSSS